MEPWEKNLEKEKKFLTEFKNGEPDNETDLFVQLILRDIEKRTKYIYSSQFDLSKNPKYMFLRLNEERIKEDLQRFKNNEEFSTISKQLLKRGFQNESVWRKILSMKCEEKERIMLSIFTRQDEKRLVKAACTRELDGVFTAKEDFEFCQTVAENFLTPSSIKMNNLLIQKNNLIFLECKAFNPLKDKLNYKNRLEIFLTTVIKWLPIIYQKEGKQKAHLIFCYNGEYEEDKLSDKLLEQIDPQKTMSNKNVLELLDGFTFNIFHYDSNGLNDVFNKLSLVNNKNYKILIQYFFFQFRMDSKKNLKKKKHN